MLEQDVTIYYGMSGAMKGSTIGSKLNKDPCIKIMESAIKPWKSYQFGLFKDLVLDNDLTYGILHLVRLQDFLRQNETIKNLAIERSISDCLFYYNESDEFNNGNKLGDEKIQELVEEEKRLLGNRKIHRVLLIQRDKDFINTNILQEPTRNKTFKGSCSYYLEMQDKYIEHTKKYNTIDEIIEINNAKEYIEKTLGEKFKD
jgi:hypothetical protein